ncbi:Condensin complex subunit 2 [Galdieria sulphuraria]|uniref:Condensin complex subunit 2 n=1 Tax=Galdieria sulphuraria TaxID=130081 RepID=M2XK80_GALSU|nr:condensin complex subunit 2 [Galdieria sulphuraria]EME30547.1 condensin complex subunit 2 [Galdieria sulphuraria]GJD06301.1 Condensin complex subunit 2 [Galdieria sulphuraria]|eukprot:XP_005707067.1 condensin complex subunit 2 [Galdieria sulphuraria]
MEEKLFQESSWTTPKSDKKAKRRLSSFYRNSPHPSVLTKTPEHQPSSSSSTAISRTPLRFNDDEAEKQAARKAKREKSLFQTTSKELEANRATLEEKLDPRQLAQLYSTTIKLCRDNKINAKNSWSLALIDHLRSLVVSGEINAEEDASHEIEEPTEANFQLAGVTLDASTKIYSYRVDSVHTSAYSVLGDLTRSGGPPSEKVTLEENDSEETVDLSNVKKKHTQSRTQGECTLEKNIDNISVKSYDVEHMLDPLFQVISRAIHNTETNNSLLHALNLSQEPCKDGACHLVFDSQRPFFASIQNGCVGMTCRQKYQDSYNFVKKSLHSHLDSLSVDVAYKNGICPEMLHYIQNTGHAIVNKENQTPGNVDVENPEMMRNESHELEPIDYSSMYLDSHDGLELEAWNEEGAIEARWKNSHGESFPLEEVSGMDEEERKQWITEMFAHGADMFQVGELLDGNKDANMQWNDKKLQSLLTFSWAGPTHWKFVTGGRNVSLSTNEHNGERRIEKRHRSKVDKLLDFSKPVEDVDFCSAFAQPKNSSSTLLSNASWLKNEDSANLLPPDLHYQPSDLFRLFLKPTYLVKKTTSNVTNTHRNDHEHWDAECLDEDIHYELMGNQDEEWNTVVGNNPSSNWDLSTTNMEELEFVEQPYKVEKVDIPFATMAKNVDIRQLKQDMWRIISQKGITSDENESLQQASANDMNETLSLQRMVTQLFEQFSERDRKNITSPYLFICLLHLANEKGLFLRESEDLSDIFITSFS